MIARIRRGIVSVGAFLLAGAVAHGSETEPKFETAQASAFYLSARLGRTVPNEAAFSLVTISASGASPSPADSFSQVLDTDNDFDASFLTSIEGGYRVGDFNRLGVRLGISFDYRSNYDLTATTWFRQTKLTENGAGFVSSSIDAEGKSRVRNLAAMANVYLDIRTLSFDHNKSLVPWFGVGLGWSRNRSSYTHVDLSGMLQVIDNSSVQQLSTSGLLTSQNVKKDSLAWQVMAGLGVSLNRRTVVDIGYRYVDLGDYQVGMDTTAAVTALAGVETVTIRTVARCASLKAREFFVGLRYEF